MDDQEPFSDNPYDNPYALADWKIETKKEKLKVFSNKIKLKVQEVKKKIEEKRLAR